MKRFILLLMVACYLIGCAGGFEIKDDSKTQLLAYASGKTFAITINKRVPHLDEPLSNAWINYMNSIGNNSEADVQTTLGFYNEVVQILGEPIDDPYDLIGDLAMLLSLYGAQFDETSGIMIVIQTVPREILKFFEMGYSSGRKVALR